MAIEADVPTIQKASTDVRDTKAQIDGQLGSLRNLLQEVSGAWQGAASAAFGRVMSSFDEESKTLMGALDGIGEQLQSTGHAIQANEDDANQSMAQFDVL